MGKRVIVGAGQVGRHLAGLLPTHGHEVTVTRRSGFGPENVARIAADATDRDLLTPGGAAPGETAVSRCLDVSRCAAWSEYLGIRHSATPSNVPALSSGLLKIW